MRGDRSGGDLDAILVGDLLPLRAAMPLSVLSVNPGKCSADSCLAMGVAEGSIETADRIGNTRSMDPGLRTEVGPSDLCEKVGDGGTFDRPVNIETVASRGSIESRPMGFELRLASLLVEAVDDAEPRR